MIWGAIRAGCSKGANDVGAVADMCARIFGAVKNGPRAGSVLFHMLFLVADSIDEGGNALISITGWDVASPYGSRNTSGVIVHAVNAIATVSHGEVKVADIRGEAGIGFRVWSERCSKQGVDIFDAGFQHFACYSLHCVFSILLVWHLISCGLPFPQDGAGDSPFQLVRTKNDREGRIYRLTQQSPPLEREQRR